MAVRRVSAFQSLWTSASVAISSLAPSFMPASSGAVACKRLSSKAGAAAAAEAASSSASPMGLVLFVPSMVCGCLCYWQYERMAWKDNLIKVRSEALKAPALSVYSSSAELQDYDKVTASGVYLHDKSVYVGPRPRSIPGLGMQMGYLVITPLFDAKRNGTVMVNRGWVPKAWDEDIEALKRTCPGETTVTGVVQPSEKPSSAVPDNVPDKLEYHWVDVPALARSCGLPPDTPLIQEVSSLKETEQGVHRKSPIEEKRSAAAAGLDPYGRPAPPAFPIPKNASDLVKFTTMPTDHLMYSLTWGMLCVALALMARSAVFFPKKHKKLIDNRQLWSQVTRKE